MNQSINQQFEELFDAYSDVIFRLCLFKTSDQDVAHDLTQDVFTKLYEYLGTHKVPDNPKSFIYQMARNRIIDHYRKHTTDSLETIQEDGGQFAEGQYGHEQTIHSAEYNLAIDAMHQLDETYREVLYLRLVEDYSVTEISEQLDITASNVSVRINRGKKQLASILES